MTMSLALRYFFSIKMNAIFSVLMAVFLLVLFIPSPNKAPQDGGLSILLPLMFSALLLESTIASVQQNEVLRLVPKLLRKVRWFCVTQFIVVGSVCFYAEDTLNLIFPAVLLYWFACSLLKLKLSDKYKAGADMAKALPFFLYSYPDILNFLTYTFLNVWSWAGLSFTLLLAIAALQFISVEWNTYRPNREANPYSPQSQEKKIASASKLWRFKSINDAHALTLYLPQFSTVFILFLFVSVLFVLSLFGAGPSNIFVMALLGIYISALAGTVLLGDRRSHLAWYALRPGAGNATKLIFSLLMQALKRLALAALFCVCFALLWLYFKQGEPSVLAAIYLLELAVWVVLLSFSIGFWLSSMRMTGFLPLSALVIVGIGSGFVILFSLLSYMNDGHDAAFLRFYSPIVSLLLFCIGLFRYRRIAWL
ncbi:hypothetical protein [Agaribacterium sp. ZY112]|uniref:hypothetical protein n=1 Tax=Agaribacterium sp. ZY112 TaxID=3233574 RepID=UPI0035261AAB